MGEPRAKIAQVRTPLGLRALDAGRRRAAPIGLARRAPTITHSDSTARGNWADCGRRRHNGLGASFSRRLRSSVRRKGLRSFRLHARNNLRRDAHNGRRRRRQRKIVALSAHCQWFYRRHARARRERFERPSIYLYDLRAPTCLICTIASRATSRETISTGCTYVSIRRVCVRARTSTRPLGFGHLTARRRSHL